MNAHQPHAVKMVLKELMLRRGLRYEELADALGVSLPTVRRFLTREDLTLERLAAICDWLKVSLADVVNLAKSYDIQPHRLSREQERFFARFPRFYTYLRYLGRGQTPEAIAERHGLSAGATDRYLTELTQLGLIAVDAKGRVRLQVEWPAPWAFPGPLQDAFGLTMFNATMEHLLDRSTNAQTRDKNGTEYFFMTDSALLPDDTYAAYIRELRELFRKYTAFSRLEARSRRDPTQPVTAVVIGIDHFDAMTATLGDVTETPDR